jgi:hypothetical protein
MDRVAGRRPFTEGIERTAHEDAEGRQYVLGPDGSASTANGCRQRINRPWSMLGGMLERMLRQSVVPPDARPELPGERRPGGVPSKKKSRTVLPMPFISFLCR